MIAKKLLVGGSLGVEGICLNAQRVVVGVVFPSTPDESLRMRSLRPRACDARKWSAVDPLEHEIEHVQGGVQT